MATDIVDGASPAAAIAASTWIFMERPWMRSIFRGFSFCEIACEGVESTLEQVWVRACTWCDCACNCMFACVEYQRKLVPATHTHTHTTLYWMQRCFDRPLHVVTSTVPSDMPTQYVHFAALTVLS